MTRPAAAPEVTAPPSATGTTGAAVPPAVALTGVSVRFARRPAPVLRDVSVSVAPGEQVVVLGPSGSGKSTLLQVVTGAVPHSVTADLTGEVGIAGRATGATPVVDRSALVGVLAQDPTASVCLPSVEQEIALPLENHAVDPARIDTRIGEVLDLVGAGHLRLRSTATLSGGEAQRVGLAAALVTGPEVLLLDEPTSMLDPAGIASVRAALDAATGSGGAGGVTGPAVVLVEHRLDEWAGGAGLAGLPARAVALDAEGRVMADGPTPTVLHEHAADLVAAGCWLPLDAELAALTGAPGGLSTTASTDLLRAWARTAPEPRDPTRAPAAPVLAAHGLDVGHRTGRRRAPRPVLTGVDLEVRPGEVVALLGANGIGKSTLLLTLAGLLPPLAGRVRGPRPGLVFQNAEHQFLAHTVADEVGHGLSPGARSRIVADRLGRHRLAHLGTQSPFRLSGGEKRRLSLAAMLAHDRPCLLLDEPTLGLDRRDTVAAVRALRDEAEGGRAVVVASHDLRTVATLADRVVLLGEGRVLADGTTAEVLSDRALTARAGIVVPALVTWLLRHVGRAVGHVLHRLDDRVAG